MDIGNQSLHRAAGIIGWHLVRGHGYEKAIAAATNAEKLLTDKQIEQAAQWAQAALLWRDMVQDAKDSDDLTQLAYIAGLPLFEVDY